MKLGLPQGFVTFGLIPHRILYAIHKIGKSACFRDILEFYEGEEFGLNEANISMGLLRLCKAGFIHQTHQKNEPRPTYYYWFEPMGRGVRRDRPIPGYVKMRRRRARMKVLAANSSVFNFAKAISNG